MQTYLLVYTMIMLMFCVADGRGRGGAGD